MSDSYIGSRPATGLNAPREGFSGSERRWRTDEDEERCRVYLENWNLFLGKHYAGDGGPWPHPLGEKGVSENIPYKVLNLLGKSSRVYSDMICGDEVIVSSEDEAANEILGKIKSSVFSDALLQASIYGFCGLQPMQNDDGHLVPSVILPQYLYPTYSGIDASRLEKIRKAIPFLGVDIGDGKKIDILYEETHYRDRVETRLYEISGNIINRDLEPEWYKKISDRGTISPCRIHGLGKFEISIVINSKIGKEIISDYTIPAKRSQEGLNAQKTQISRILKLHANPKLIAPISGFVKDPETGKMQWAHEGSEVLVLDGMKDPGAKYEYLVWNGQLEEARKNKEDEVYSLCAELDMSPQLLNMTSMVGGTTADTSEKLKQLMQSTVKRAERKRDNAWEAIYATCKNILKAKGINAEVTIKFPEILPRTRTEKIEEASARKRDGLITTKEAIKLIDDVSEEEAEKTAQEIIIEQSNSVKNPFSDIPSQYAPPVDNMQNSASFGV